MPTGRRQRRCPFTVPGSVGDRCRRRDGHQEHDTMHHRWHFPDCGSAVDDEGNWIDSPDWLRMLENVQRAGELHT